MTDLLMPITGLAAFALFLGYAFACDTL